MELMELDQIYIVKKNLFFKYHVLWPVCVTTNMVSISHDGWVPVMAEYLARWSKQWVAKRCLWNSGARSSKPASNP